MCKHREHRWLSALAVAAALTTESVAGLAQTPIPAAIGQSPTPLAAPQFQPTAEQTGDALMAHQRYQAAIEAYQKAPHNSAALWNKMGIANQLMFNAQEAARCYQMALKLDRKNTSVMNNLATIYDSAKQYRPAERLYRQALKIDPQSALISKNLGTNLLAQHKYKKGWEAYQTALAIDPAIFEHGTSIRVDNPAALQERGAMNYYMARGCVRAGMNDRAIEYLRMALNEGFINPQKLVADTEFAGLRGLPAFEQLLASERLP